jgi:hypothetical protein
MVLLAAGAVDECCRDRYIPVGSKAATVAGLCHEPDFCLEVQLIELHSESLTGLAIRLAQPDQLHEPPAVPCHRVLDDLTSVVFGRAATASGRDYAEGRHDRKVSAARNARRG